MAFDPDKYLASVGQSSGGFDPDAYLAKVTASEPKTGAGAAALEHFGNAATLGYLPQLQAMAQPVMDRVLDKITGNHVADPKKSLLEDEMGGYIQRRDANIARLALEKKEHPLASYAGMGAGIVGSALGTGGMGALAEGATAAQRLAAAAKTGAILGGAANPGDTEGDFDPLQVAARAKNSGIGAGLGVGGQLLAEGIGAGSSALSEYLADKAAKKATRALGRPTPTQALQMAKSGQDVALGRTLLDEGAVPVLGTHQRIADRVAALKEKAGQDIGDLLDSAGDQKLVSGGTAGVKLLDEPEVARLRGAPGMKGFAGQIDEVAEDIANHGDMSLKEAHQLRRDIDRSINFNKPAQDRLGTQLALTKSRGVINDEMNQALNELDGSTKDALLKANKTYSNLAKAEDLGERGIGQDQANRAISLTDTIAGVPAIASGHGAVGLALGAANKFGRTFGNSIQARGYDAVAKGLAKVPKLAEMAESNPAGFTALVQRIGDKMTAAPETTGVLRNVADDQSASGLKGEALWASRGAAKIGLDPSASARLPAQSRRLLIEASELPQNSPRLQAIKEQIKRMGK